MHRAVYSIHRASNPMFCARQPIFSSFEHSVSGAIVSEMKPSRQPVLLLSIACMAALFAACARSLPETPTSAALYRDLERLVGLATTTGWGIDRLEVKGLESDALQSVCRTPFASRFQLLAWLDRRIEDEGGPVEQAYRSRGNRLSKVKHLLALTRVRMTLSHAMDAALSDCPFWIAEDDQFRGRQIADDRWQLSLGGGGKLILVSQAGEADINFGGSGRLMFGRAFGPRISILTGLDTGASASFPRDAMGNRGQLVLGIDAVIPVALRYRFVNSYLEVEAGPLGRFTEESDSVIPGIHMGIAFGGRASRKRWFFPGAVFGIVYEQTFPTQSYIDPIKSLKLGFRVAIDLDF